MPKLPLQTAHKAPPKFKSARSSKPSSSSPAPASESFRTGPPPGPLREDAERFRDEGAVGTGSLPDYTPVYGMSGGYSGVPSGGGGGGGGGRGLYRRWCDDGGGRRRAHLVVTALLAGGLIASLASSVRKSRRIAELQGGHLGLAVGVGGGARAPLPPPTATLTRVAFGSCLDQNVPHPHWDALAGLDSPPDVMVLMGDNVYGKCDDRSGCDDLRDAYRRLASHPSFMGARATLPMIATLDDHDYGMGSDGDGSGYGGERGAGGGGAHGGNPHKDAAKGLFLDFFGAPPDDPRRRREGEGVYASYVWGPEGRRLQILILDVRYSRSEFEITGDSTAPHSPTEDVGKRMLSDAQWSWLESELDAPADVRLIVSSVQVVADGHGFECWRMIPHERNRLYALLKRHTSTSRVLLLSGDRLVGGFYEHDSTGLREITSSSLTHSTPYGSLPPCSEEDAFKDDYDWETCDEKDPRRVGGFVHENNFGWLVIDWEGREVTVSLRRAETYPAHTHGSKKRVRQVYPAGEVLMEETYSF